MSRDFVITEWFLLGGGSVVVIVGKLVRLYANWCAKKGDDWGELPRGIGEIRVGFSFTDVELVERK